MSYLDDVRMSEIGKATYTKRNTVSDNKKALKTVREYYISSSKALQSANRDMQAKIAEIKSTYAQSKASEMIDELLRDYKGRVDATQKRLSDMFGTVIDDKQEQNRKHKMTPPPNDFFSLMQSWDVRGLENVPHSEWLMALKTYGDNYQCSSIIRTKGNTVGKTFTQYDTVEEDEKNFEQIEMRFRNAIEHIENPYENGFALEFYRSDLSDSYTSQLIEKMDTEIATTVQDSNVTPLGRLKEARNHALHVGNMDVFNAIANFIIGSGDQLQTPEEQEIALMEKAEKMIALGMNAKEKNPMRPAQCTEEEKRLMGEYLIARDQGNAE